MKQHLQWPFSFRSFIRIEIEEDDPWENFSRAYIASYRSQIEEIAKKLSDTVGVPNLLDVRFNPEEMHVEVYFKKSSITFVRVNVYGNMGTSDGIVITTVCPLSLEMQNIFCDIFGSKLPIKFITLL